MQTTTINNQPERQIYKISQLNLAARKLLEGSFPSVWVEGEISNFICASSGHWYFTLKDAGAQVRCAMFSGRNRQLNFKMGNGLHVLTQAKVSLYEGRGDYQLIVEYLEEVGDGALRRAYEILKQKLSNEGLFDSAIKPALPSLPKCIGVVTSPTGAAIRDILSVLKRRFPAIPVFLYPSMVQGQEAAPQLVKALQRANQHAQCDVIILARGGGSLEDLWPFNEEMVARAIFASRIPIISGVGHEIDFTIADFVASRRAPTPSAAAELIVPDAQEWLQQLIRTGQRLIQGIQRVIAQNSQQLGWLNQRLKSPKQTLQEQMQRVDQLELALQRGLANAVKHKLAQLNHLSARLQQHTPLHRISLLHTQQQALAARLQQAIRGLIQQQRQSLANLGRALDAVSPLATLDRGYAIARLADGRVVRNALELQPGDTINVRVHQGSLNCTVKETLV